MNRSCGRNGCSRAASMHVQFDRYLATFPITTACLQHAVWWVRGFDGVRIARAVPIGSSR